MRPWIRRLRDWVRGDFPRKGRTPGFVDAANSAAPCRADAAPRLPGAAPEARFTCEGGFEQPEPYAWTPAAEEEMTDRLTRLLDGSSTQSTGSAPVG